MLSQSSASPGSNGVVAVRRWTTPRQMQAMLAAISAGAVLTYFFVLLSVNQMRSGIHTVGTDAAPSIIAAQHIRAYLADMDSNLANELIGKPGQNMSAVTAFEDRRKDVIDSLVTAAQNITYGDAERSHIQKISEELAQYEEWAATARSFHERGDAAQLAAYRHAVQILRSMLDEAVQLDKVNNDALESAYAQKRLSSYVILAAVLVCGIGLLGTLIFTQLFLLRRMNRVINPGMLGATVLGGLFLLLTVIRLLGAGSDLRVAKEDAFDSVRALWQARAVAFTGNGDESRWLLDRPLAPTYEKSFYEQSNRVVRLEPGVKVDPVLAAKAQGKGPGEVPYLAKEIDNITFAGEQAAAERAITRYADYFQIDGQIRALENSGQHDRAVALCIGNDRGESNWAFDQFDAAMLETLDINQKQFDRAVASSGGAVNAIAVLNPFVALGVIALAFVGMRPRLQEYAQ